MRGARRGARFWAGAAGLARRASLLAALTLTIVTAVAASSAPAAPESRGHHHRQQPKQKQRRHHKQRTQARPPRELLIEGAGDGHGVGMSQWGAFGYAEHGWSATAILAHYYRGTEIGHVSRKRIVKVMAGTHVKRIPLEAYVRGVVGAEMSPSWPQAALEAQAIASRTYAITDHAGGNRFDVYSDIRSQTYLGRAAQTAATDAAVRATTGEVVTYQGQPAITYFFASSGGTTESVQNSFIGAAPEPWLTAVSDPYDGGPLHRWTVRMTFAQAAHDLRGLVKGQLEGIEVLRRGRSPRVVLASVLGSAGNTEVSGPELAGRLGLYASWAYFSVLEEGRVRPEPDLSGIGAPAPAPEAAVAGPAGSTASPPAPLAVQGGVRAP